MKSKNGYVIRTMLWIQCERNEWQEFVCRSNFLFGMIQSLTLNVLFAEFLIEKVRKMGNKKPSSKSLRTRKSMYKTGILIAVATVFIVFNVAAIQIMILIFELMSIKYQVLTQVANSVHLLKIFCRQLILPLQTIQPGKSKSARIHNQETNTTPRSPLFVGKDREIS